MSFKKFYIESTKVFVAEMEDSFEVIDFENFDTKSVHGTLEDAQQFVETKGWTLVDKDPEWDELNNLSDEMLDEMEESDFGSSLFVTEYESDNLEMEDAELNERLVRKRVVRNGKRVLKIVTDKPGYRVVRSGGRVKEVRMKSQELRKRKRGQKIASRKRKAKSASIQRKRLRSFKKRIK